MVDTLPPTELCHALGGDARWELSTCSLQLVACRSWASRPYRGAVNQATIDSHQERRTAPSHKGGAGDFQGPEPPSPYPLPPPRHKHPGKRKGESSRGRAFKSNTAGAMRRLVTGPEHQEFDLQRGLGAPSVLEAKLSQHPSRGGRGVLAEDAVDAPQPG